MARNAQSATTMQNSTNAPNPASLAIRGDASHPMAQAVRTPSKSPIGLRRQVALRILKGANGDPGRRRREGQDQARFEHQGAFANLREA